MRKAADPGVVERISSFLSDNPLTHSWRDSVGGAINWGERQLMSDEDLRNTIGSVVKKATVDGQISDEQLRTLSQLKGSPIDRQELEAMAAQHEMEMGEYLGQAAKRYMDKRQLGRDELKGHLAAIQGPLQQNSEWAGMLASAATHPVAAYSAVGAGGALATAGGMAAYDWWMAQQQQAEKEGQLPLVRTQAGMGV